MSSTQTILNDEKPRQYIDSSRQWKDRGLIISRFPFYPYQWINKIETLTPFLSLPHCINIALTIRQLVEYTVFKRDGGKQEPPETNAPDFVNEVGENRDKELIKILLQITCPKDEFIYVLGFKMKRKHFKASF